MTSIRSWSSGVEPVLGSLIPLASLFAAKLLRCRFVYLCQFFAGFCLIANGAYIGLGSFSNIGDAGDLAHAGCPQAVMVVFGIVCAAAGLWLWNRLGSHFGLKEAEGKVDQPAALGMLLLLVITLIAETMADSR